MRSTASPTNEWTSVSSIQRSKDNTHNSNKILATHSTCTSTTLGSFREGLPRITVWIWAEVPKIKGQARSNIIEQSTSSEALLVQQWASTQTIDLSYWAASTTSSAVIKTQLWVELHWISQIVIHPANSSIVYSLTGTSNHWTRCLIRHNMWSFTNELETSMTWNSQKMYSMIPPTSTEATRSYRASSEINRVTSANIKIWMAACQTTWSHLICNLLPVM